MKIALDIEEADIEWIVRSLDNQHAYTRSRNLEDSGYKRLADQELFKRWQAQRVSHDTFEKWIEKTVRPQWGLKAAVRAYHIALRGIDVWITKMARSLPVSKIETKDRASVIGAQTTAETLNVFAVTQALTWLAGDRTEFQDELAWKSQVYQMIEALPGAKIPGHASLF